MEKEEKSCPEKIHPGKRVGGLQNSWSCLSKNDISVRDVIF
jgi:hypothetical protein